MPDPVAGGPGHRTGGGGAAMGQAAPARVSSRRPPRTASAGSSARKARGRFGPTWRACGACWPPCTLPRSTRPAVSHLGRDRSGTPGVPAPAIGGL